MDDLEPITSPYPLLSRIDKPSALRDLDESQLVQLADEIRRFVVEAVTRTGGHLGSNLGVVELSIAMHRVFDSPRDVLLFDTGHQAYVHKLLTGRMKEFSALRKAGGLSGYPNRSESEHDWIENSHASTALSYAHGIAAAFRADGQDRYRRVVAVVGDGALTGGMAYEALNNLGHADSRVVIILNDNGRSYAPTVSKLSSSLTQLRLNPSYSAVRNKVGQIVSELPGVGQLASASFRNLTAALRELVEPHVFFEALGIRYTGPIDGHDIPALEQALRNASTWNGPIVLHVLTRKGKGYAPAEDDEVQRLHDLKAPNPIAAPGTSADRGALRVSERPPGSSYTEAFTEALLHAAASDRRIVALTAAMPGPTGLLPFQARYPDRFLDVGIAEQHAMTAAAGMALAGLRPVVAIYSTFLSRAFDQENLDVGLHRAPVVICADRAGITGDDGPSHHGVLDMVLALSIPEMAVFAPSEPAEIGPMLEQARALEAPALIRYPKTPGPVSLAPVGVGLHHRELRAGAGEVVLIGVGKIAERALNAAALLVAKGLDVTVLDPRVIRPVDPALLARLRSAKIVVTAEDGMVHGGAGQFLRDAIERDAEMRGAIPPRVVTVGVPSTYVAHGTADVILTSLGLDPEGLAATVAATVARFGAPVGEHNAVEKRDPSVPDGSIGERSAAPR